MKDSNFYLLHWCPESLSDSHTRKKNYIKKK